MRLTHILFNLKQHYVLDTKALQLKKKKNRGIDQAQGG